MRLVGLFDLATGVWIGAATAPFRSSERKLWKHVRAGDTIVVRALMSHGKSPEAESASFKGTIDRLNHWLPIVLNAPTARLRKQLVTDLIPVTDLVAPLCSIIGTGIDVGM